MTKVAFLFWSPWKSPLPSLLSTPKSEGGLNNWSNKMKFWLILTKLKKTDITEEAKLKFCPPVPRQVQVRRTPWEPASTSTLETTSRASFRAPSTTCSGGWRSAGRRPPSKAGLSPSSRSTRSSWRYANSLPGRSKRAQSDSFERWQIKAIFRDTVWALNSPSWKHFGSIKQTLKEHTDSQRSKVCRGLLKRPDDPQRH